MTTATRPTPPAGSSDAGLARWLDAYGAAWEARDADAAAVLFTEAADYHWGPFDRLHGREEIAQRWSIATSGQRDIRFEHTPLTMAAGLAFAHWRCTFQRLSTGMRCELDGVFVLRFEADGRCSELREWWLGREREEPTIAGSDR